jgi:hypothetical protein
MAANHLFTAAFWRTYWVSIRRSRRDSRDLKIALRVTAVLLLFVIYYGGLIWNIRAAFDAQTIGIFIAAALFAGGLIVLARMQTIRDRRQAEKEQLAATDTAVRDRLAANGFWLAILLGRAGSEQTLKEKILPEGISVITRQVHLEKLREGGQWDSIPATVRDLLLAADGHWTTEQIFSCRKCFEVLRCLRWVLCFDEELKPLTYLLKLDYSEAQQVLEQAGRFLGGRRLLPTWDIRVQRNEADAFFGRCYAEMICRGLIAVSDEPTMTWASGVKDAMVQPHQRDVLVGVDTVAELDEHTLRYAAGTAFHRYHSLQLMMRLQDGEDIWTEWEAFCFPAPVEPDSIEA